jgi:hypothetical protein
MHLPANPGGSSLGSKTGTRMASQSLPGALSQVVTILDLTSGSELATLIAPGRGKIDFLGPPTGHLDEYPVQCAC